MEIVLLILAVLALICAVASFAPNYGVLLKVSAILLSLTLTIFFLVSVLGVD